MQLIESKIINPKVWELLSYATTDGKIEAEYNAYLLSANRMLYGMIIKNNIVGCIGIEFDTESKCEIKHIAVNPISRKQQIGRSMILYIIEKFQIDSIFAETDKDAVNFYASIGFTITSLGEKYPGVERFLCVFNNRKM
ncbi:GNAT family N-acetyltransferase [Psychrobacillus sp. INOP01]|uniref:GNAT family N-acetyltransferase n=1 Tax=Psychrobacillus sp. INOP01 TaxID=2829187 RepID=UPI001BA7E099|nr:GNAT family N-acetyltransferase [Psychrobacillus sp. INOP01]QUG41557.1 GNAT family N-acetyltransferase [Psychrobacillus sp. INOP01]